MPLTTPSTTVETLVGIVPDRPFHAPSSLFEMFVRGWRPACGYACAAVLLRAVAVPMTQLYLGLPVEPIEWVPLTAFAGLLVASRSYDKSKGTA